MRLASIVRCSLVASALLMGLPCLAQQNPPQAITPPSVSDVQSAPFADMVPVTPGTPFAAGRSIGFWCTASGNITVTTSATGRLVTFPIQANATLQSLPLAVTNIVLGSGTAASFWVLP